jgi:hypothetical protein
MTSICCCGKSGADEVLGFIIWRKFYFDAWFENSDVKIGSMLHIKDRLRIYWHSSTIVEMKVR